MIKRLLSSSDPAIRFLAGDVEADVLSSPLVQTLLKFPDVHPYKKYWGTHWRLVALADLGVSEATELIEYGLEQELTWLTSPNRRIVKIDGLTRRCASQEGNAVYACSKLGFARDLRVKKLVSSLLEWQWPDGGWNCDRKASGRRSSFHETITPALGLAAYYQVTDDFQALKGAQKAAELLLEHHLFRSLKTQKIIDPVWLQPKYPPYWHYDILQGLRLMDTLGLLSDSRTKEALQILAESRRKDGRFSGSAWNSAKQPDAVYWGRGPENEMLNLRIEIILNKGLEEDFRAP